MAEETAKDAFTALTRQEKDRISYLRQRALLAVYLEMGALTKKQRKKSLHDSQRRWAQ